MTVLDVLPFSSVGAAGSTPIKLTVKGTPNVELFGKLYSTSHMRSDRWYKLGRMVMYGSLEDERPFNSVRRLTEYEDYILRYLQDYGIPSAGPAAGPAGVPPAEATVCGRGLAAGSVY